MPVWVEGETVKGYKVEQFADAFHRVLGVSGVRGVRSALALGAASTPPNPPNPLGIRDAGNGRIPLPGDSEFSAFADLCFHEGRLTESEWLGRRHLHALIHAAETEDNDG
jgi:hypothetical protein